MHEGKNTHWIAFYHLTLLTGEEQLISLETHKHEKIQFFDINHLPPKKQLHSMILPTLKDFKNKIEDIAQVSYIV